MGVGETYLKIKKQKLCLCPVRLLYQKYHRLGGLNNRHLFLIVQKAGKFKIKKLLGIVSGESLLPGS